VLSVFVIYVLYTVNPLALNIIQGGAKRTHGFEMGMSISKTVDFGLQRTCESYTRDLSMLLRFQFGAAFRKWGLLVLTILKKKGLL